MDGRNKAELILRFAPTMKELITKTISTTPEGMAPVLNYWRELCNQILQILGSEAPPIPLSPRKFTHDELMDLAAGVEQAEKSAAFTPWSEMSEDEVSSKVKVLLELPGVPMQWVPLDDKSYEAIDGREVLAGNFKPHSYGFKEKLIGRLYRKSSIGFGEISRFFCEDERNLLENVTHFIDLSKFDL